VLSVVLVIFRSADVHGGGGEDVGVCAGWGLVVLGVGVVPGAGAVSVGAGPVALGATWVELPVVGVLPVTSAEDPIVTADPDLADRETGDGLVLDDGLPVLDEGGDGAPEDEPTSVSGREPGATLGAPRNNASAATRPITTTRPAMATSTG